MEMDGTLGLLQIRDCLPQAVLPLNAVRHQLQHRFEIGCGRPIIAGAVVFQANHQPGFRQLFIAQLLAQCKGPVRQRGRFRHRSPRTHFCLGQKRQRARIFRGFDSAAAPQTIHETLCTFSGFRHLPIRHELVNTGKFRCALRPYNNREQEEAAKNAKHKCGWSQRDRS